MRPFIESLWYRSHPASTLLCPLSFVFGMLARHRKQALLKSQAALPVPVIVVGNITVGGTGKTPVVLALVDYLTRQGVKVGVVSRGYGSKSKSAPLRVTEQSTANAVGDEPLLIFMQSGIPVVVDSHRVNACRVLIDEDNVDVIISDDGLQHYHMPRALELAVVDANRGLGNGRLLPAGPLREPPERLQALDKVLINGENQPALPPCDKTHFRLIAQSLIPLGQTKGNLQPARVHAVAGIGNPDRFFKTLMALGFECVAHAFPDHYAFSESDVLFDDQLPVIMTAKDAVKCHAFTRLDRHWVLPVKAEFDGAFWHWLDVALKNLIK
ncbi:MAG: tetraacyldisaccharide 4'-kinase [Cellvibrionales bacterium]|nr:tetraacyldisaccharide 4'-kinase [Cellvibrionales bacterium]